MKIDIEIKEKPPKLDEGLNQQEMELAPFHFCIEELNQYIEGKIIITFDDEKRLELDIFYDFSVCYEDIIESIASAKNDLSGKGVIWFFEQGSDFYIHYETKYNLIEIEYKKGNSVGFPNKKTNEFRVSVSRTTYIETWRSLFKKLTELFYEKLKKKIEIPF